MNGFNNPSDSTPLPYTSSPLELLLSELHLIKDILLHYPASIPGVLQPIWSTDPLDELCLFNPSNLLSLFLHLILLITQSLLLLSLIYTLFLPIIPAGIYFAGLALALTANYYFCTLLNGFYSTEPRTSTTKLTPAELSRHESEHWIFINGVSVGHAWFQSNLNLLSTLFRRPISGIHNITYGIIFDLFECLIQRDSCYATADIRTGYSAVKKALLDAKNKKVVLIVHSQGGIEAGAILDWLLDDLPATLLAKLEIYTFGSAANHFNNPNRTTCADRNDKRGVVKSIEHYTNSGDFVSRFGILGFIRMPSRGKANPSAKTDGGLDGSNAAGGGGNERTAGQDHNRFKGRLFTRNAKGHMLNQHYLAYMFERERDTRTNPDGTTSTVERVKDHNSFMDSVSDSWDGGVEKAGLEWSWPWNWDWVGGGLWGREGRRWESMVREDGVDLSGGRPGGRVQGGADGVRVKNGEVEMVGVRPRDLSRLWLYRNGESPPPDGEEEQQQQQQEQEQEVHFRQKEELVYAGWTGVISMNSFAR